MSQGESLADALATINRLKLSHMEVSGRLNLSGKFGACVDLNLHLCGGLSLVASSEQIIGEKVCFVQLVPVKRNVL